MISLSRYSVDSDEPERESILTGTLFREEGCEILSPLSCSIVCDGIDRGYRDLAASLMSPPPTGRPYYVAYLAFRPFLAMSTLEPLLLRLPSVTLGQVWATLAGRTPPGGSDSIGARRRSIGAALKQARFLWLASSLLNGVSEQVARAEDLVVGRPGLRVAASEPFLASAAAGRDAWALHARMTALAMVLSAALTRATGTLLDPVRAAQLTLVTAHQGLSVERQERGRAYLGAPLGSFEVASGRGWLSGAPVGGTVSPPFMKEDAVAPIVGPPTVVGATLIHRLIRLLQMLLAERERTAALGFRALHCVRTLLDRRWSDLEPAEAALLSVWELTRLSDGDRMGRIRCRAEELEAARSLELPYTLRLRRGTASPVPGSRRTPEGLGTLVSPGFGEGTLVSERPRAGDILVGRQPDARAVRAIRPAGVVADVATTFSSLALACRELGIPLVTGLSVSVEHLGRRAMLDGWTGRLSIST